MRSGHSSPASQGSAAVLPGNVVLSPFVNEPFPAWDELLSAHDVARLTRRPRWVLAGLAFFGHFPRKRRYHGRGIGWARVEVSLWLAKESIDGGSLKSVPRIERMPRARQARLPLGRSHTCGGRGRRDCCSLRRRASR